MNNIQIDVIDNFFDVELRDEIFEKIKSSKWSFNGGSLKNPIWHADNLEQDKFFSHYVQDLIFLNSSQGNISYPRQRRSYFTTDQEANGYLTQSVAGQAQLDAGQTVWIVIQRACSVGSESFSYFTGWLVQ